MRPSGSTRRCPTTSGRGNLTALRELALLWLADQVDAALAKYRADNKITDTWEARERVVVAVTGGPESETLVRRASRIASKSSAELMVVHVVRGDGLSGVSAPQMGKVRELATSLGATVHTVVGDDVPTALLDFAREMNATQLVIGTSRRSRWARIFDEGIGAAVVQQSGKIDVHMVTHEEAKRGRPRGRSRRGERHAASWLAALVVPSAICAVTVLLLDPYLGIGGESALFFIGVLVVALLGGVAPAALSAVLSGLLLNYFLVAPRHTFTIAEPDSAVTDRRAAAGRGRGRGAGRRRRQTGPGSPRASQEAELLALFAGSVLRGADLDTLLERVRETYSQRAVSMLRGDGADGASIVALRRARPVRDGRLRRHRDRGRRRRVLDADGRTQTGRPRPPGAGGGRQAGRGAGQAARTHRGGQPGRGDRAGRRTAPLAAVGGQPRPAHAAGGRQGRGVEPARRRRRLLPRGHRRTAGHHRGVHRPAHRAGRQPARLVAAGRRGGRARAAPGVPGGDGAARAGRNQQGHHRLSAAADWTG